MDEQAKPRKYFGDGGRFRDLAPLAEWGVNHTGLFWFSPRYDVRAYECNGVILFHNFEKQTAWVCSASERWCPKV